MTVVAVDFAVRRLEAMEALARSETVILSTMDIMALASMEPDDFEAAVSELLETGDEE